MTEADKQALYDLMQANEERGKREYPQTIPACPSWCALEPRHAYDLTGDIFDGEPIDYIRMHNSTADNHDPLAFVQQMETNNAGTITFDVASIWADEPTRDGLTAEQAETVAADLVAAARLLRSITA